MKFWCQKPDRQGGQVSSDAASEISETVRHLDH